VKAKTTTKGVGGREIQCAHLKRSLPSLADRSEGTKRSGKTAKRLINLDVGILGVGDAIMNEGINVDWQKVPPVFAQRIIEPESVSHEMSVPY